MLKIIINQACKDSFFLKAFCVFFCFFQKKETASVIPFLFEINKCYCLTISIQKVNALSPEALD
jgi:hypothetical protein